MNKDEIFDNLSYLDVMIGKFSYRGDISEEEATHCFDAIGAIMYELNKI